MQQQNSSQYSVIIRNIEDWDEPIRAMFFQVFADQLQSTPIFGPYEDSHQAHMMVHLMDEDGSLPMLGARLVGSMPKGHPEVFVWPDEQGLWWFVILPCCDLVDTVEAIRMAMDA
jgi:hypothetical protein